MLTGGVRPVWGPWCGDGQGQVADWPRPRRAPRSSSARAVRSVCSRMSSRGSSGTAQVRMRVSVSQSSASCATMWCRTTAVWLAIFQEAAALGEASKELGFAPR